MRFISHYICTGQFSLGVHCLFLSPCRVIEFPECWPKRLEAAAYPDRLRHQRFLWLTGHEYQFHGSFVFCPTSNPSHLGVWYGVANVRVLTGTLAVGCSKWARFYSYSLPFNERGTKWTIAVMCFCAVLVRVGWCPVQLHPLRWRSESSPPPFFPSFPPPFPRDQWYGG